MVRFRWFAILFAIEVALFGSRTVMAQSKIQTQAELQSEIDQLKQKVDALEAVNVQLQHLDQQVKLVDHKLEVQQGAKHEEALNRRWSRSGRRGFSFGPRTTATTC